MGRHYILFFLHTFFFAYHTLYCVYPYRFYVIKMAKGNKSSLRDNFLSTPRRTV